MQVIRPPLDNMVQIMLISNLSDLKDLGKHVGVDDCVFEVWNVHE